jgi:hypothetical protein
VPTLRAAGLVVEVVAEDLADVGVGAIGGISCRGLGLIFPSFGLDALILNDEGDGCRMLTGNDCTTLDPIE